LGKDARRPERKESTIARDWWLSPWRAHQRSLDMGNTSYCDVVRHQGTWRMADRWLILVSSSESAVSQADTAAGVKSGSSSSTRRYLQPRATISTPLSTNHIAGGNRFVRSPTAIFSGLGIFPVHCTISFSFSHLDRPLCRAQISYFHVNTN
jgi:hypothetical protein